MTRKKTPLLGIAEPGRRRTADGARRHYARPILHAYGSVGRLTMGGNGTTSDIFMATNAMMFMFSARRLKERICRVGTHPLGIGLYLFHFRPEYRERCGAGRHFGVMADEVEAVMPQAVSVDGAGHKMVNYAMLGIRHAKSGKG